MINLKNISKVYNPGMTNEVIALNKVNLNIHKGEMISIMGRSGSGKTTLLHIIAGLDKASSGEYLLDGTSITELNDGKLSELRNQRIGIALQDFALIETQTALSNVKLPMFFNDTKISSMNTKAKAALELVGIAHLHDRALNKMSGGQKQRVAIARALVNDPDLIIADEPTGALDTSTANEIMQLFIELNELGKTVIVVTHDDKVAMFCRRHLYIENGVISDDAL